MRPTVFTEHALRALAYLALHPGRFVTIAEIAAAYDISANHLMKVAQHLAGAGHVTTLRGPHGGLRLAQPANKIWLGDVVRSTEPEPSLASRSGPKILPNVLDQALAAFMAVLDRHTVADMIANPAHSPPSLARNPNVKGNR